MTYTNKDVQRLVSYCQDTLITGRMLSEGEFPVTRHALIQLLKPFQRDPDAEVIEAMAKAIHRVDHPVRMWEESGPAIQELYLRIARAGLDALEEFRHAQGSQASRPQTDQ